MPVFRIKCGECGLWATQIVSGGLGVTSFDAEECALRCDKGREAKTLGDPVCASVLKCQHLTVALASCGRAPTEGDAADASQAFGDESKTAPSFR